VVLPIIVLVELSSLGIRISRSENLPVLSQSATAVLRLVDDSNAGPREIESAIAKDSAITGKILKAANSAYYGGVKVPTVGRAVHFLGMNSVRSLVVGIAFQQMSSGMAEAPSFNKLEFWKHSLAVATAARILGRIQMPGKAEELYCAGVMHDVGMLVLDRFMAGEFQGAIETSQRTTMPLYECEKQAYKFDHTDVGALLADHWALTPIIKSSIQYHHSPMRDSENFETTKIVAAADAIAHQCGYTNNVPGARHDLATDVASIAGLSEDHLEKVLALVTTEVEMAESALRN
jgi:HD-like signal output (HDOD) protein